jgi:hypothetical protein
MSRVLNFKTFFKGSTAAPAARALLEHFGTPRELAAAPVENIADVLRNVRAYSHAMRAAELQTSAQQSAGAPMLPHHQWRQAWLIAELSALRFLSVIGSDRYQDQRHADA